MEVRILTVKEVSSAPGTGIQKHGVLAAQVKEGNAAVRRRRALMRLDRALEKGNCKAVLSLMKQFKAHPAGFLRGFGAAAAPKVSGRVSSFELARRSGISSLQIVIDAILHSLKRSLDFQLQEEEAEILPKDFGKTTAADSHNSIYEDHLMCMQHEAGHFLVGYLLGVLPRRYKVPSVEDLLRDKFARGNVEFVGFEFLREVGIDPVSNRNFSKGKLNKETLKKFSCVTLGGLVAEHLVFGYSELLHSDVEKLDRVHKWLGFTEAEVDFEHRQAAEVTLLILFPQIEALSRLAEAMALGRSLGFCIETIEHTFKLGTVSCQTSDFASSQHET
ncbi:uncharacterized protein LOC130988437 isoform X2 [Salvia miltiorrhiza]|uniref:uncharacterized protein LOC130988437 isoform X2 n=1 Tax=Salvia miltiorrhiza TaxID=226208 RepID=UPI0025AC698F|nr:uncharacterized protein LOC130988437 isoform X2 [Salvia miltiorrhiza]